MSNQMYRLVAGRVEIYNILNRTKNERFGYDEIISEPANVETDYYSFFFTKQELIDYVNNLPDLI